jgi:hypothetical protein
MINSFRNYLVEEEKTLYFVWGRMNPPTAGHEKLLDFLKAKAGNNPFRIYLTQSEDNKKNPIPFMQKVKFARKGFPQYARQIMMDKKLKTIFDAMTAFYNEGFKRVVIVAGSDRVREYEITLNKYNGKKAKHGFYNFERISVMSAGNRDPESKGVEGVSGTKLRGYAEDGDFTKFAQYMPKRLSNAESKQVYNAVRKGIGLKEQKEFKNHIQLNSVSPIRESYIDGKLFNVGDTVVVKESGEVGTVKVLGSNYVIVENSGNQYRKWLDAVEQIEQPRFEYEVFDEGTTKPNIWDNIRKRRAKGEPPKKPGDKGYPKTLDLPEDPCWDTHKQVGTKMKNGKEVPNCVPRSEKIEVGQDKDIDELPGSQPATFQKGIKSKSTKAARHRHFQRMTKRDDNDPSAYKDAPGDKAARKKGTKPSQYTKKFKQMFGEDQATDIAKKRIEREKERDKMKHDRMMDRARMRDTLKKNRETT